MIKSIGGPVPWTAASDGRFKRDVCEDVPGLEFINRLRPLSYNLAVAKLFEFSGGKLTEPLKDACEEASRIRYTGFVAQEVHDAAQASDYDFSGVRVPTDAKLIVILSSTGPMRSSRSSASTYRKRP